MGYRTVFTTTSESRNGVANVALRGELDLATAPELEAHLAPIENDGVSTIMLDLRELSFIDSSGLRALLRAKERATMNGHQLILVRTRPSARRLFELTGAERFLLEDQDVLGVLKQFNGSEAHGDVQRDNRRR